MVELLWNVLGRSQGLGKFQQFWAGISSHDTSQAHEDRLGYYPKALRPCLPKTAMLWDTAGFSDMCKDAPLIEALSNERSSDQAQLHSHN